MGGSIRDVMTAALLVLLGCVVVVVGDSAVLQTPPRRLSGGANGASSSSGSAAPTWSVARAGHDEALGGGEDEDGGSRGALARETRSTPSSPPPIVRIPPTRRSRFLDGPSSAGVADPAPRASSASSVRAGRVFCLGFNKTGTRTLQVLLRMLGYAACHNDAWPRAWWAQGLAPASHGTAPKNTTAAAAAAAARWIRGAVRVRGGYGKDARGRRCEAFSDGECADFRHLATTYPDAVFVLNVRGLLDWMVSRWKHVQFRVHHDGFAWGLHKVDWARRDVARCEMACWVMAREEYHGAVLSYFNRGGWGRTGNGTGAVARGIEGAAPASHRLRTVDVTRTGNDVVLEELMKLTGVEDRTRFITRGDLLGKVKKVHVTNSRKNIKTVPIKGGMGLAMEVLSAMGIPAGERRRAAPLSRAPVMPEGCPQDYCRKTARGSIWETCYPEKLSRERRMQLIEPEPERDGTVWNRDGTRVREVDKSKSTKPWRRVRIHLRRKPS